MAFRGIQATNIISTVVGLSDPLLILNKTGEIPTDIGFLGKIGPTTYAGLIKDAETNNFLLISQIELSATTVDDVNALDASIVKGNITVGTLTADSIISASIPTQYTDALARASISATGSLSYDSTTGVISFTDSDSSYATLLGYNPADETDTSSIVLNPGDAVTPATFRGDVINNSGTVIVDVSSTSATFTGGLMGNTYGDVYNPTGANKILESGTGNNDSQLAVTVASIDELTVNDSFVLPKGTAAQRPTNPVAAQMFFNTETNLFEGYDGTAWIQLIPATFFPATP